MCHKIRCDGEFWKLFGFQSELNKAQQIPQRTITVYFEGREAKQRKAKAAQI